MLVWFALRLVSGWLVPKCPVDISTKVWVERRMLWFAERFGTDRFRNTRVVTPCDSVMTLPRRMSPKARSNGATIANRCP